MVREGRKGGRDLAETWFELELDRAVAMTGKPLPSQGVFRVLDVLPLCGARLGLAGCVLRSQCSSLLAGLISRETVPPIWLGY